MILNIDSSKAKKGYYFGREGKYFSYVATNAFFASRRLIVGTANSKGHGLIFTTDVHTSDFGAVGFMEVL